MIDIKCPVCRGPAQHDDVLEDMLDAVCTCGTRLRVVLVPMELDVERYRETQTQTAGSAAGETMPTQET